MARPLEPRASTAIPAYQKVSGISGNLSSVGSDTLANLMTLWAESYKREYPNLNIQIQAAGSSTAPPALTESTAGIGPMSRKMKDASYRPSSSASATAHRGAGGHRCPGDLRQQGQSVCAS